MFPGWSWCFEFPSVPCFDTVVWATGRAAGMCIRHAAVIHSVFETRTILQLLQERSPVDYVHGSCAFQHDPPMKMMDLFEDIKDGVCLLSLLEVLSGETLVILLYTVVSAMGYVCLYYSGPVNVLSSEIFDPDLDCSRPLYLWR